MSTVPPPLAGRAVNELLLAAGETVDGAARMLALLEAVR